MFEEIIQREDDREALVDFLIQVKRFIWSIAFDHYLDQYEWASFEDDDLTVFQEAALEYRESGNFELLISRVIQMSDRRLALHGLTTRQLFAKRTMIRRGEQRFLDRPSGRLFRRLLQAVDVLLDSILNAVPAGTALSELKDMAGLLPKTE